MITKLSQID